MATVAVLLAYFGADGDKLHRLDTALRLLPIGLGIDADQPAAVHVARILATVVFAYATFKAFAVLFRERFHEIQAGRKRGHTIVCGLGRRGVALTESLLASGKKVVAVELDASNLDIDRLRDEGAAVLVGDATDPDVLERAGVAHATQVVAVCPQDAVNAQIAARVLEHSKETAGAPVDTFVHVSDARLCKFLVQYSFESKDEWLEFFNVYERGADALLRETASLREEGPILVVGAGQFGIAVISELAREQFERRAENRGAKVSVYVVDREAGARAAELQERYSRFHEVCDLHPLELDVDSPAFDRLFQQHPELAEIGVAFVCFDSDPLTITTALNLLDQTQDKIVVTARVFDRKTGIAGLLERTRGRDAESTTFRPLSIAEGACHANLILEGMRGRLAREAHAVYRRDNPGAKDDVPWEELTEKARDRNRSHADDISRQLGAVGYRLGPLIDWGAPLVELSLEDIEKMSELEHERWMDERLAVGWRVGPVKDEIEKTHPDLVPWSELPEKVRDIDRSFVRARPAMLAKIGIEIYRAA